jgi:hypothetical protein
LFLVDLDEQAVAEKLASHRLRLACSNSRVFNVLRRRHPQGNASTQAGKGCIRTAVLCQFRDKAFEDVDGGLRFLASAAREAYAAGRKSPQTQPADVVRAQFMIRLS